MNDDVRWLVVIVASTVAAIVATLLATGNAISMVPLFWFFAVCPGMPYVRMFRGNDPVQLWTTAIGLSIAIVALVAEAMLYTHTFSAIGVVCITGVVACAGAVIGRLRTRGDPEPAEPASVPS
jgi:hypothetical protein